MTKTNGRRRVVVTGQGVVTPVGTDVPKFWAALKKGTCGIVVLVMIPKGTDDRAFIVNAFNRNHKSGNNYRTSLADVDALETMSEDEFPALSSDCV